MNKIMTLILTVSMAVSASAQVLWEGGKIIEGEIVSPVEWVGGMKQVDTGGGSPPLDPNLVLWYQFLDDTTPTPDSSINANSGVVNGAVWGFETNNSIEVGYYDLDGVNDYIISDGNSPITAINSRTISTWVKRNTTNTTDIVFSAGTNSANQTYQLTFLGTSQDLQLAINGDNATWDDAVPASDEWNHITVVQEYNSRLDEAVVYVNGVSLGTPDSALNGANIPNTAVAPINIGRSLTGANHFDGLFSDFRMYNTNLSASAVDDIYTSTASGYGASTEPTDLRVWYEFNTNTTPTPDSSRYGNDGIVNGATWVTNSGGAYSFDGVNDYLITSANIGLSGSSDRTIMGWVNFQDNTGFQGIFSQNSDATGGNGSRFELYTDGASTLVLDVSGGQNQYTYSFPTNEWIHLAVQYDNARGSGPQSVDLYINGSIYYPSSSNSSPTIATTDDVLSLGAGNTGGSPIEGFMDDWRVYDEAKSASEINEIYLDNAGKYGASTEPIDLRVWYEFNDNTTPTPDSSRYNNDGTVNGATWVTNAGGAYSFDGVNDYISMPQCVTATVSVVDYIGFSIWANTDTTNTAESLFAYNDDGFGVILRANSAEDGEMRLTVVHDAGSFTINTNYVFAADQNVHIGYIGRDGGSGYNKVFINGDLVHSNSFVANWGQIDNSNPNRNIGTSRTAANLFWSGEVSDFRMFQSDTDIPDSTITNIFDNT